MREFAKRMSVLTRKQEGQALVEYALILSMISVGALSILVTLSGKLTPIFETISNAV